MDKLIDDYVEISVKFSRIEKLCIEEAEKEWDERDSDELVAEILAILPGGTFNKYFGLE